MEQSNSIDYTVSDLGIEERGRRTGAETSSLPGMRGAARAARLLLSLGPDEAAKILKEMDPSHIESLVNEMARVRRVAPEEKKELLTRLGQTMKEFEIPTEGGMERAREILTRGLGEEKAREIIARVDRRDLEQDFEFLEQVDPVHMASALTGEHPQIAAVALSHIRPKIAAEVLKHFDPELRAVVSQRIARTSRIQPDAVHRVARVLRAKFERPGDEFYSETGGAETLANILNHLDRKTEDEILDTLGRESPDIFNDVKDLLYTFEELGNLDVREMRKLLSRVNDDYILAAALRGAGEDLRRHFFNALSQNRAADILEEMEYRGPINVREINEARNYILVIARKMDEETELVIKKGKEEFI